MRSPDTLKDFFRVQNDDCNCFPFFELSTLSKLRDISELEHFNPSKLDKSTSLWQLMLHLEELM